jgi:hypothetical protein
MRHSECHLNVLDNFMLPIVSHWDIYEELHFIQDGGHPHFALLVYAWLGNCFPSWIGHQGVTRRPPFCGVWQWKPRIFDTLERWICGTFAAVLCDFLRKNVEFVFQVVEVCAKYLGHGRNMARNDSAWALKWCKNFSNIAFCLGDTAM